MSGAFAEFRKANGDNELALAFVAASGEEAKRTIMAQYIMKTGDGSLFQAKQEVKITSTNAAKAKEDWYYRDELKLNLFRHGFAY